MSVSVTCNWKTGIPLALVNSFSSIQVTWLQKAVKAGLKIKHVIKHLINLHCIENIIVVLVYVLEFPLNEKKKTSSKLQAFVS